ncbi:hypothetical protein ACS8AQ_23630, partial [Yersinia enterocolitica]|uniref:hypothetical protein n=1 Tax=Yersinia enterocolitica TaxID=630 RepID=UPI003F484EBB
PQNDVTLKMPAFEWVHVQLHQQKGMISLSPPTICNSAGKGIADEDGFVRQRSASQPLDISRLLVYGICVAHILQRLPEARRRRS